MSEEPGVTPQGAGEGTPGASPAQPTGQPGTGEPGANPSKTPSGEGEGSGLPEHIPYGRFKEVNEKLRAAEEKAALFDQIAPFLESFKPEQPAPADPNQFKTIEEYDQYVKENLGRSEKALEAKFEAKLAAERKLSELRETYPEMKTDSTFRDFVITKMQQNPGVDAMEVARQVKEYFGKFESRGREAAKKEFLEKGAFNGKPMGNVPFAESDEDKAFKEAVINAGGKKGIF